MVDKYRDPAGERVFGFYHWYSRMDSFSAALNYGLKKIGKILGVEDLEFYAARHSWATIANNEAGVDKYTVHTSLNHVDETMRVTDIYIKKSWDFIDKANRKVLDTVKLNICSVDEPVYLPKQKEFCLSKFLKVIDNQQSNFCVLPKQIFHLPKQTQFSSKCGIFRVSKSTICLSKSL